MHLRLNSMYDLIYRITDNQFFGEWWLFDVNSSHWALTRGQGTLPAAANFGTHGVPSPTNEIGIRYTHMMTTNRANGHLDIFGGTNADLAMLNDLWRLELRIQSCSEGRILTNNQCMMYKLVTQ